MFDVCLNYLFGKLVLQTSYRLLVLAATHRTFSAWWMI